MRKITSLFYLLAIFAVMTFSSLTAFAIEGDGTEGTPFLITDQGELELVTDFPESHFRLANDIVLEGIWVPLCTHTSSGYFEGVFDGAGYTISNLLTDGSAGGLFKNNRGTIKNLKIIIAEEGMTGSGTVTGTNYGTISNCAVKGNISSSIFEKMGGICAENDNVVTQCKFEGNIENTYTSSASYMCIGGICGRNSSKISNCYFIGGLSSKSSDKGGICGNNYASKASITNCYAVPTFNDGGYGIASDGDSITKSYYNKTVSGLTSTDNGTPKSTAAMKMKLTYSNNGWDFDTIWGINKNINNGYPYLLWEYPNLEVDNYYSVNNVKITDLSGNELDEIPDDSFYFEINVTKNDNLKNADCLIIAVYDESNVLMDIKYMSGVYYQNQTMTFGTMINKTDKKIGNIKGFVWDSVTGMTPLSNSLEITN